MTRNELSEMIALAERLAAADEPAVLATLFAATGSTYRPLGSMMVAGPGSSFLAGGVSGGCLEEFIARRGRRSPTANPRSYSASMPIPRPITPCAVFGLRRLDRSAGRAWTPEHLTFLREFAAAHQADRASTVACVIDTSASPGIAVRRMAWASDDEEPLLDPRLELLRRARCSKSAACTMRLARVSKC